MPENNNQGRNWNRRNFMSLTGVTSLYALSGYSTTESEPILADENSSTIQDSSNQRVTGAARLSPRDFHEENYEVTHVHRRKEAIRTLLADPKVNQVASNWIASFEAYEPLSNHLDAISVQGVTDYTVEGSLDQGKFDITAKQRQVAYGLVDRRRNELVALQINKPTDVSWTEKYDQKMIPRGQVLLDQPEVQEFLQGKDWWAMAKVAESITAFEDEPHGAVTVVLFPAVGDDGLSYVSGYINVEKDEPEFSMVHFVDEAVRYPIQKMAREISPNDQSVLGDVPSVPTEKRPLKTANNGYHRFEQVPEKTIKQDNWQISWSPPKTMGVTFTGKFNGKPVFDAMNSPVTFTGYDLPPRNGRNTRNWFFPDDKPVFNGHHLFWDIHSTSFGGPGQLGKVDYPDRRGHPSGFQFRTHYHTGAQGRSSVDFHSGARFAPYNYNISYEFFSDGQLVPIWRRHGPGYVTESLTEYGVPDNYEGEENVVQQYISAQALDVTPGTQKGVKTQLFDGDTWKTPQTEFYYEGEPGTKVRFTNPSGSETIDIPLNRGIEIAVVKRRSSEIGPAKSQKTRVIDMKTELDFYHPAQYVDGDNIQNERVIAWILLEASMDEVPHPAGVTGYAALAELQLNGYGEN